MKIRETGISDVPAIETIQTTAFGRTKGPVIADLAIGLLSDETAMPVVSLVAEENDRPVGHIVFTRVHITPAAETVSARILAPLAVIPEAQQRGVGGRLIRAGLDRLKKEGVHLVFVLGHPDYYPRHGFTPAGRLGFEAPYPIPEEYSGAWMVLELNGKTIGKICGNVQCSEVLDHPEHWRE